MFIDEVGIEFFVAVDGGAFVDAVAFERAVSGEQSFSACEIFLGDEETGSVDGEVGFIFCGDDGAWSVVIVVGSAGGPGA